MSRIAPDLEYGGKRKKMLYPNKLPFIIQEINLYDG
jgi:hypothetical protein